MTRRSALMKRFYVIALCWLVFLTVSSCADTIPLWGRWEHTFKASTAAAPETELTVELTSPSGKILTVAGFSDGEVTWRVRFMPDEAGRWLYRTRSDPVVEGLNGKYGEFDCHQETGNTRFLQHGPVGISPGNRFFQHADGTPFFWIGDTVWYGAILSTKADW